MSTTTNTAPTRAFPGIYAAGEGQYRYSFTVAGVFIMGRITDLETAAKEMDHAKFWLLRKGYMKFVHRWNFPALISKWVENPDAYPPDAIVCRFMEEHAPRYVAPALRAVPESKLYKSKLPSNLRLVSALKLVRSLAFENADEQAALTSVASIIKRNIT